MTQDTPTLLIVDDEPMNIAILMDLLKPHYRLVAARSGAEALRRVVAGPTPDLVLLDIMMPDMDGYTLCQHLKADDSTRDIPVIFISAMGADEDETRGLTLGAVDYITKPISPPIVLARVRTHVQLKQAREALRQQNRILEERVADRTRELALSQDVTILCLTSLAETRDSETGNHIRRTQNYVRVLARTLARHPRFAPHLSERVIELLYKSAPLHDIGKVGVPDRILLKPGRLDPDEFEIMKSHTTLGSQAIQTAERAILDSQGAEAATAFLRYAREIVHSHHEKWDGTGYPDGLAGEAIPLSARLMAVADVYDALISRRVYKPPLSHEEAIAVIRDGRGTHFDPDIVDAFVDQADPLRAIAQRYRTGSDE